MRAYPASLMLDSDGGFTVTFRDVPKAITEGDSREEALFHAEDALESTLAMYVPDKQPLPAPSAANRTRSSCRSRRSAWRRRRCTTPCAEQRVGRAELARRLRWHLPQVNRVLDLRHASKMEQLEAGFAALGLRLIVDVAKAA